MSGDPTCPSCGVPYSDHEGLVYVCADLLKARKKIGRVQSLLAETIKYIPSKRGESDRLAARIKDELK